MVLGRIINWIRNYFRLRKEINLGIYGCTNVGKTTLANRIAMDWIGEEVGKVSRIPHETRSVQRKE
ncbi:MAG TPA: GTP-binding protein, partial [Candidatus Aenigmarchaeota archaeon]|nr:GTP-binding protein [Candidatus Aenigmarchaeota archaeon]